MPVPPPEPRPPAPAAGSSDSSIPLGKGYTTTQWQTWFKGFVKNNPKIPRYEGDNLSGKGKTWDQLYPVLYAQGQKQTPKLTPDQVAEAELILIQTQAVATGIGATLTFTGTTVIVAGKAAVATAQAIGNAIPGINGLSSALDFLKGLTSANLWIRVAKVAVGGVILIVGLLHLTGADKQIGGYAAKAVKVAPFLV